MSDSAADNAAENLRQMENRAQGDGTGIIDLAGLYRRQALADEKDEDKESAAEDLLRRVQESGDVDKDLRVLYWQDPEERFLRSRASYDGPLRTSSRYISSYGHTQTVDGCNVHVRRLAPLLKNSGGSANDVSCSPPNALTLYMHGGASFRPAQD